LDLGAPVNCVNDDGLTPLYLCVMAPFDTHADVVEMLLRDYAQHGVRDASGYTELHQVTSGFYSYIWKAQLAPIEK